MKPSFEVALSFFKENLRKRGFSEKLLWAFREDICVHSVDKSRYLFVLEEEVGSTESDAKKIYNRIKDPPLMFFAFIKDPERTIVTLACDDWDFAEDEGDIYNDDWKLHFCFSTYFSVAEGDKIEFITDMARFKKLVRLATKYRNLNDWYHILGPYDFFLYKDIMKM